MFKIQRFSIVATDKKTLVEGIKNSTGFSEKLLPSGACISTDGRSLIIKCSCKRKHEWKFVSKIPRNNYSCSCGKVLIQYIKNIRYKFINR